MPHDAAALALYDESLKQLRLTALDFPAHEEPCSAEKSSPRRTSAGLALPLGKPVLSDYSKTETLALLVPALNPVARPLLFRDRALGVLSIKSLRENAFSPEDAELFARLRSRLRCRGERARVSRIETLKNKLEEEKLYLEEEIRTEYNFEEIIGNSSALRRVLQNVETVAATDSTVLIYGENRHWKRTYRARHSQLEPTPRTNSGQGKLRGIPTGLLESESFGHERGAFTGAMIAGLDDSNWQIRGPYFLMRSRTFRSNCNQNSCVYCRSRNLNVWAARALCG